MTKKVVIALAVLACACAGEDGLDGMDGIDGIDGADGVNGRDGIDGADGRDGMDGMDVPRTVFRGRLDPAVEQALVMLQALRPDGEVRTTLTTSVTDASGAFTATQLDIPGPLPLLQFEADTPDGTLFAFVTSLDQTVSPATTGVAEIIGMIAATRDDEVTVMDFAAEEVDALVTMANQSMELAGTEQSDLEAVFEQVLEDVGEAVADATDAVPFATDQPRPNPPAPVDDGSLIETSGAVVLDIEGIVEWQIERNGRVQDGSDDAYDGMFQLLVDGTEFPEQSSPFDLEDDTELVLGPEDDLGGTGLSVTRKIYATETDNFIRFVEFFENPGADPVTVEVRVVGNLGSDGFETYGPSSNGDSAVSVADSWHTSTDGGIPPGFPDGFPFGDFVGSDPALGFYYPGATVDVEGDRLTFTWSEVTVPAGATVAVVHFGFQRLDRDMDAVADQLRSLDETQSDEFYEGLTAEEVAQLANVGGVVVRGEAGAVAPMADITFSANAGAAVGQAVAHSDGSFVGHILVDSVETIDLSTSFGRNEAVMVPME